MTFRYYVDFDNDNAFGTSDDITADVMRAEWRIGMRNGHQRLADENSATLVVNNSTGKYAPENPSSPLYGQLHPRKRMRILYDDIPLWTGWLHTPQVTYATAGDATGKTTATLHGVGGKQLLEQIPARLPLYSGVSADVILADIFANNLLPPAIADVWRLDNTGVSVLGETTCLGSIADFTQLDDGKFKFEVFGDTAYDDLWAAIHQLILSERGYFFFNRDGMAVFWNRHRVHSAHATSADVTSDGEFAPQTVMYRYGERLVNEVWVQSQPRQLNDEAILWSLDAPVTLAPYQTLVIEARLRRDGGQYVGAGGGLIANPTFGRGVASITITPLGGKAVIRIKNATSEFVSLLRLTLQGISSIRQNAIAVIAEDEASLAQYGRFGMKIKLSSPATVTEISHIAQYEVFAWANPRGNIEKISMTERATAPHPQRMLWTVGDVLAVNLPELHHADEYFIIGEAHTVDGTVHGCEYALLQKPHPFWQLGQTGYAELGHTTWVGY